MTDSKLRTRTFVMERAEDDAEGIVRGYVTTWDQPYDIGWGWQEEIARGAFTESLQRGAVPIMWQHDWDAGPIGVTRSTTEDDKGLLFEVELFLDDPRARAVYRAMAAGALREWSIGFYAEEILERTADKVDRVTKGRLAETSVVVRGANPNTSTIEVRKAPEDVAPAVEPTPEPAPVTREIPAELLARLAEPHVRAVISSALSPSN